MSEQDQVKRVQEERKRYDEQRAAMAEPVDAADVQAKAANEETIAASYAREASHSADGVSLQLGEIQEKFTKQAETLREQHASLLIGGIPDVGGVTADEQPDPTIAPLIFGTGMSDNLAAGRQDYGSRNVPEYWPEEYPGY
jgi:hypothetical protein